MKMKFHLLLYTVLSLFSIYSSIGQPPQDGYFVLKGKIKEASNERLEYQLSTEDTTYNGFCQLNNGAFTLNEKINVPQKITLTTKGKKPVHYTFFVEPNKTIYFTSTWNSPTFKVVNSQTETEKKRRLKAKQSLYEKIVYLDSLIHNADNDTLKLERELLHKKLRQVDSLFILHNKHSYYAALLLTQYLNAPRLSYHFPSLENIYNAYPIWIKNSTIGKNIKMRVELENLVGKPAPGFSALDAEKDTLSLAQFKGKKLVLLCFTASWCIPCKATEKDMKVLCRQYKNKNLQIISIYVDTKIQEWRKEIENILWKSTVDLKSNRLIPKQQSLLNLYHIHLYPTVMLIGYKGDVVTVFKDHSLQSIKAVIDKLISKKS